MPSLRNPGPLIRHAFASLRQHRLRSLLSTLGIACGVLSFLIMMSVGEGAKRETLAHIEQLGLKNILIQATARTPEQLRKARESGSRGLTLADAELLRRSIRGVADVAALRELKLSTPSARTSFAPQIFAVTSGYFAAQSLGLEAGRPLADGDARERRRVCVLGSRTARELGEEGQPGGSVRIEDAVYRVVGVLKPAAARPPGKTAAVSARCFDGALLVPLGEGASAPDEVSGAVGELIVQSTSRDEVRPSLPMLNRVLEVAHRGVADYRIVVPQELLRQAELAQGTFDTLLGSIALISLLAGGIGIMNIMLANVAERRHEIGIRRALGATHEHILAQFLAEAVILTCLGGLLGVLAGLGGLWGGSLLAGWQVWVTPSALAWPLLLSLLMGLIFGLYPAAKAASLDPVVALSH